jgi:hypothetical protein
VIESSDGAGFLLKPGRELGLRNLHRNIAVKLRILRLPDFTHTAFAKLRKKLVSVAESIAGFEVHGSRRGASINVSERGRRWRETVRSGD